MKKIMFFGFTIFSFILFQPLVAKASDTNFYKTTTNRNIIYVAEENNEFAYSWQFDRETYKDNVNFSLIINESSSKLNLVSSQIDKNIKTKYLFFEHHGVLPTTAIIKVAVADNYNDGDKLYLYYYNENSKKLEFIEDNLIVKNGYVSFEIKHCSDYVLTGSIVKTALNNPQSMTIIIIILVAIGVAMVAGTLFLNNKK